MAHHSNITSRALRAESEGATLTDRYVQAVIRTIPERQRADVAAELRVSIADQLDARADAGEPAAEAERSVLTALGDPDRLSADYADRPLHLVGPRYYLQWWRLLKLLLWIVVPLAAFAIALGQTLSGAPVGSIIGGTIGATLSVAVHLMFWTTVVFVIIERAEAASGATAGPSALSGAAWSLDDLPESRADGAGLSDAIASVVLLFVAAGALVWDQLVGTVYLEGQWMPFLHPGLWPWWVMGLLIVIAVGAVVQVVVYIRRRWTAALAALNLVLNVVVAACAITLLAQGQLLNPEFWNIVLPTGDAPKVFGILSIIAGFGIAGIAAWSSIDGFLKARRAR